MASPDRNYVILTMVNLAMSLGYFNVLKEKLE